MQEEINIMNVRRLMSWVSRKIASVVENDDIIGKKANIRNLQLYLMETLYPLEARGEIMHYDVKIDDTDDGKLICNVRLQPSLSCGWINVKLSFDSYLNSIFYIKMINNAWNICTLRDIYEPDYQPMAAIIGDTEHDWKIHTIDELLDRSVPLDEIKVYRENVELIHN